MLPSVCVGSHEVEQLASSGEGSTGKSNGVGASDLGYLIPLQCGHNASFSEWERERFLYLLSQHGWMIDLADP
jgi:hypothetical protein